MVIDNIDPLTVLDFTASNIHLSNLHLVKKSKIYVPTYNSNNNNPKYVPSYLNPTTQKKKSNYFYSNDNKKTYPSYSYNSGSNHGNNGEMSSGSDDVSGGQNGNQNGGGQNGNQNNQNGNQNNNQNPNQNSNQSGGSGQNSNQNGQNNNQNGQNGNQNGQNGNPNGNQNGNQNGQNGNPNGNPNGNQNGNQNGQNGNPNGNPNGNQNGNQNGQNGNQNGQNGNQNGQNGNQNGQNGNQNGQNGNQNGQNGNQNGNQNGQNGNQNGNQNGQNGNQNGNQNDNQNGDSNNQNDNQNGDSNNQNDNQNGGQNGNNPGSGTIVTNSISLSVNTVSSTVTPTSSPPDPSLAVTSKVPASVTPINTESSGAASSANATNSNILPVILAVGAFLIALLAFLIVFCFLKKRKRETGLERGIPENSLHNQPVQSNVMTETSATSSPPEVPPVTFYAGDVFEKRATVHSVESVKSKNSYLGEMSTFNFNAGDDRYNLLSKSISVLPTKDVTEDLMSNLNLKTVENETVSVSHHNSNLSSGEVADKSDIGVNEASIPETVPPTSLTEAVFVIPENEVPKPVIEDTETEKNISIPTIVPVAITTELNSNNNIEKKKATETAENVSRPSENVKSIHEVYNDRGNSFDLDSFAPPAPTSHVVISDYFARRPDELSLRQGDLIGIEKTYEDNWGRGQNISQGRKRGFFPLVSVNGIKSGPSQMTFKNNFLGWNEKKKDEDTSFRPSLEIPERDHSLFGRRPPSM
ncbi:hypothetical protein HDU92_004109 [Lobulomyces angularis]|nr:hypothetical protein HDU92_004109 [Lobulomyces angularis]